MMNEETRQRMIIRQSSLKLAVELLTSEMELGKINISIPVESIKLLSKKFEDYVFEVVPKQQAQPEQEAPKEIVMN